MNAANNQRSAPDIEDFWQRYLATLPADSEIRSRPFIAEAFGDSPDLADELAALILAGTKTATCSALWEYEAEGAAHPRAGTITILLTGRGEPCAILEATEVTIRAFRDVDAELAYDEGEDDRTLASWRAEHWKYFSRVLPKIGREPTEDMPLVCERFRVLWQSEPRP
jgi:uncharacterized protein YhfF